MQLGMLWQRWRSVGSLEDDLLKILSSVLRKNKTYMLLFLNVGGNRPRTVVSHPFSAACSFLPWAASKSPSLSCGTLLIAVRWAVSTGRPSPLPLFHTRMSSMLHGDPEDSCVVIITIFPLWVKVVCTWSPIRGAQPFIGCSPRMGFPDTSLKRLGKSEWRVCLTPQSWPGEPHWWTLCQLQCPAFWDDGFYPGCLLCLSWWDGCSDGATSLVFWWKRLLWCFLLGQACEIARTQLLFDFIKTARLQLFYHFLIGQMAASVGSTESLY